MPFFRYECEKCEHTFRVLHLEGVDENVSCPLCEGTEVRRLLPRVAVQFKGSGYYKTDRANNKSKAGTKGVSDKDTPSEAGSKESKDSKPNKSSEGG